MKKIREYTSTTAYYEYSLLPSLRSEVPPFIQTKN